MSAVDPKVRCATCLYWTQGASALATAAPDANPLATPELGTCALYPPVAVETKWFPVWAFPEVHADRFCGDWEPDGAPDDGAREDLPTDNVVKLERAA